jgi:hypothetical protein
VFFFEAVALQRVVLHGFGEVFGLEGAAVDIATGTGLPDQWLDALGRNSDGDAAAGKFTAALLDVEDGTVTEGLRETTRLDGSDPR